MISFRRRPDSKNIVVFQGTRMIPKPNVSYCTDARYVFCLNIAAGNHQQPAALCSGVRIMKNKKVTSEETLQRLWSQIELLRQEIDQAERDRTAEQVELSSAIVVAEAGLLSRLGRHR